MAKLTIIKESQAARCDVCHQVDMFDAASNTCARCSALNSTDQQIVLYAQQQAKPAIQPQLIIPKNITIEELGDTFTITYHSGSIKSGLKILPIAIYYTIISYLFLWKDPIGFAGSAIFIAMLLFLFISLILEKYHLTITADQIIKRNYPNLGFTKKININEIVDIELGKFRGFDRLFLILNNGKRVKLISHTGDRAGMEFIERILKERLDKKRS